MVGKKREVEVKPASDCALELSVLALVQMGCHVQGKAFWRDTFGTNLWHVA